MRNLIIETIVKGHFVYKLVEWTSALSDTRGCNDPVVETAQFLRNYGNEYEVRNFLKERTDKELLAMYTQQCCQEFR